MRRSKAEIYLHLVWATQERQELIVPAVRKQLYSFLETQVRHNKCEILSIGGMPDHVHLVIRIPTTVCIAEVVKSVKGSSSAFVNDLTRRTPYFRWQEGYGVFSLSRPILDKVIRYVENQEHHHTQGTFWNQWEETDEPMPNSATISTRPQDAFPSE